MTQNDKLKKIENSAGQIWLQKVKYRRENKKWLSYSRKISLRMLSAIEDIVGMNQKKLAELAGVSPQQISKIIKGRENLTLQTIAKFSEILGTELISFPSFKYNQMYRTEITIQANITMFLNVNVYQNNSFTLFNNRQYTIGFNGIVSQDLMLNQQPLAI